MTRLFEAEDVPTSIQYRIQVDTINYRLSPAIRKAVAHAVKQATQVLSAKLSVMVGDEKLAKCRLTEFSNQHGSYDVGLEDDV